MICHSLVMKQHDIALNSAGLIGICAASVLIYTLDNGALRVTLTSPWKRFLNVVFTKKHSFSPLKTVVVRPTSETTRRF
jgi:hypothetical protein